MKRLKLNLYKKVVLTFMIAIIPLLAIGFGLSMAGEKIIQRDIEESMNSRVQFYMHIFESEMSRIIRMKQQYTVDHDVQTLIMHHAILSDIDKYYTIQNVQRKLKQFKESSLFVESVKMYIPDLDLRIEDNLIERGIAAAALEQLNENYKQMQLFTMNDNRLLLLDGYPRILLTNNKPLLYLEVSLSNEMINETLSKVVPNKMGETVIFDQEGSWHLGVLPGDEQELQTLLDLAADNKKGEGHYGHFERSGKKHLYSVQKSPGLNAALLVYVSEQDVLGSLHWYKKLFWVLGITSVAVILLFSLWIYRLIHKPMHMLTSAFRRVEKGDFPNIPHVRQQDEFQYLYRQFAQLTSKLKQLVEDIYAQELLMNRAELKQLQAQINPHFLYNIFFLLNRIIQVEDTETAKRITIHLGKYFKYITRNSSDEALLQEELEHIHSYIAIQMERFGPKLDAKLEELPDGMGAIAVPRLILQPIVENAFEYGLEDHPEIGELLLNFDVHAHYLDVLIEDNGTGLTEEKLSWLQERLQMKGQPAGIEITGLINVHRRLQLLFGSGYGVTLQRGELGGMLVRIRIPIMPIYDDHNSGE